MPDTHPSTPIPRQVARQAIHWLIELQDNPDPVRQRQWQEWLTAHVDHQRAWQQIEQVNAGLQRLPPSLVHSTLNAQSGLSRRQMVKHLAILLGVGGLAWQGQQHLPWQAWTAQYRTGVGERQSLALDAGLQVEMNTATAINFNPRERQLELVSGEILVTQQEPALFIQTASGHLQAARQSRFLLRHHAGSTYAAVLSGNLQVFPRLNPQANLLQAGMASHCYPDRMTSPATFNLHATAWLDGMLVASNMPLAEFLAEVSRYRPGTIQWTPAIANLRVTGTYPLADTDRILAALETLLPIRRRGFSRYWVRYDQA